jgi:transposase
MNRDVKMDGQLDVPQEGCAGRMEVLAGPTGRRRRSDAEKARIAVESLAHGAVVADIARRYGATRWQVYDWRRRLRRGFLLAPQEDSASPAFVPLAIDVDRKGTPDGDIVEVVVGDILIRVGREVSEAHLARIFRAARASG